MKVLFIGPLPEPITGQSLACQVLVDELVKYHRVEVVNLSKSEFTQGVSSFGRVVAVAKILWHIWRKRDACDVIYLTVAESIAGNIKDLLIYVVCFARLDRLVIHLHGGAGMRRIILGRRGVLRACNRFFLRRLGGAIALGQRHLDVFAGSMPRQRIHLVANFAQDEFFTDLASIDRKFRDLEPLRFLFLSNLLPGKGHLELVEAFRRLDERPRAALAIDFAGGFESDTQQREFLRSIEGYSQLRYHGTVHGEKKRELFARAHVFCLPTYYAYEGQPISILEAYASGCAVITTDHSGIFDIFSDGTNGWGVAKQSATALQAAIERAVAAPQTLHTMARGNFESAQKLYRTSGHTRELVAIIERVAERSGAAAVPTSP